VAVIIAIVLRKEIFHRIDLPRGIGNAVASVTQYTLVVVGVFMALASAGFESRHLGILAGALGVGIGFGLQTIVNNFLSGLILVFERPITVDDVVEVDGVLGVVTSIGIRASKIRQYNGDEVIVPNSDLISKRVTNRTLSDTKRRYTMEFTTGRKVAPDVVVAAVEQAVQGLEGILDDPPTRAYFKGTVHQTNHYYINYWGAGNFLDLMNNAQIAVYKALEKVGASVPVDITIELNQLPDDISTI
jgi:small-conductance mechanosensitive channel